MYLALEPAGGCSWPRGPRSRSSAPPRRTTPSRRSPVSPRPFASRDRQIGSLLRNLERVATVLDERDQDPIGLMRDADMLSPALAHLESVLAVLKRNEDNIDQGLRLLAPFVRVFTNVTGNGPWLDGYIQNMPAVPRP